MEGDKYAGGEGIRANSGAGPGSGSLPGVGSEEVSSSLLCR